MKYHLVTLGCQMNKSDSERVRTVLEQMGYVWTDTEDKAGMLGVLACSVRQKAIDKVYSRIHKWNHWKKSRNLITFVTGCVLPADKEKFLKMFDLVFTMDDLPELESIIRQYGIVTPLGIASKQERARPPHPEIMEMADHGTNTLQLTSLAKHQVKISGKERDAVRPVKHIELGGFWHVTPTYTSDFEAFVPIQNGCDKFCTFCAVPYTRGREVSRPSEDILEEIRGLIDRDYKSITLLGQNVNSYGLDKKGAELTFAQLLEKIGELGDTSGKDVWIYFTSPHPRDMTEEVIQVISRYKSLAKQVHLPIQSGDEKVLIKMNRNHSVDRYRKIIHAIHEYIPQATIFTDIIVGFTGETDEQFENTRRIMEEFKYNMAYIAMYSPRPGAVSSRWADDIPVDVKKKRLHLLSEELKKHTRQYNEQLKGKVVTVLVTGTDRKPGFLSGYTEGRIIVRFESENTDLVGKFTEVEISSAADFSVEGRLVKVKESESIG
jgi:tRNA-2-methylthio-N6-dimethylallyladenosine synthase